MVVSTRARYPRCNFYLHQACGLGSVVGPDHSQEKAQAVYKAREAVMEQLKVHLCPVHSL